MDVSTPPSLDLACPQAKADIENHVDMFREKEVSIKTKYRHSRIMLIIITATNFIIKLYHIASHEQVTSNIKVESINFIENQQTMFSVNFATTIHHIFRKGHVSEPFEKSTYSTII